MSQMAPAGILSQKVSCSTITSPNDFHRPDFHFLAGNHVAELKSWSKEDLVELGPIPYPMAYEPSADRFERREWGSVLAEFGDAIADADAIALIGNQRNAGELEALQLILAHATGRCVDLLQCWDDHSPGHVWTSTSDDFTTIPNRQGKVVVALGNIPPPRFLGFDDHDLLVLMGDIAIPAMFDIPSRAIVLPVKSDGWKLTHMAFHRLIDIELEQSTSSHYERIFGENGVPRPLCSVVAEVSSRAKTRRLTNRSVQGINETA